MSEKPTPMKRSQPKRRAKVPAGRADAPRLADPFDIDFAEIVGAVLSGGRVPDDRIPELDKGDLGITWAFRADILLVLKLTKARMIADLPGDTD